MSVRWLPQDGDSMRMGIEKDPITFEDTIVHVTDSEPLLRKNRRLFNDAPASRRKDALFYPIASIDMGLAFVWLVKHGVDVNNPYHLDKVVQLSHRPEYSRCRIAPGTFTKKPEKQYFSSAPGGGIAGAHVKSDSRSSVLRSGLIGAS